MKLGEPERDWSKRASASLRAVRNIRQCRLATPRIHPSNHSPNTHQHSTSTRNPGHLDLTRTTHIYLSLSSRTPLPLRPCPHAPIQTQHSILDRTLMHDTPRRVAPRFVPFIVPGPFSAFFALAPAGPACWHLASLRASFSVSRFLHLPPSVLLHNVIVIVGGSPEPSVLGSPGGRRVAVVWVGGLWRSRRAEEGKNNFEYSR